MPPSRDYSMLKVNTKALSIALLSQQRGGNVAEVLVVERSKSLVQGSSL